VDDVSLAVQHDVAVVPIFELQQERQQAVPGHAHDEVPPSLSIQHPTVCHARNYAATPHVETVQVFERATELGAMNHKIAKSK